MRTLLAFFDDARHYRRAKLAKASGFRTNLRFEAVLPVLDGATPLFVTAVREREIREAIAFADKEKIKIILADAYEAYKVLPLIKAHKIPVVLGPTRALPLDPDDPDDLFFLRFPASFTRRESNSRLLRLVRRPRGTFHTRPRRRCRSACRQKKHTNPCP